MAIDAWQIGSTSPPTICLCCGSKFDENIHRMHGPYDTGPYRYVCDWCWKKTYMHFPDKIQQTATSSSLQMEDGALEESPIVELEVTNGRKIAAKLVSIPVRRLRLNPMNPRVKNKLIGSDEIEIEEVLWGEGSTRSLCNEIKYSGGLSEKPIVDSSLTVIEGNRRILCLRRLDDQVKNGELSGFYEDAFEKVQCLLLPPNVDPEDVDLLAARAHVSGKKEWSPLSQAEKVFELVNERDMSVNAVAKALSLSSRRVELMLEAFRATLEYGKHFRDEKEWIHKFSYFYELFRSSYLRDWAKKRKNLALFMRLISGEKPRLNLGRQVRDLPSLVENRIAFRLLLSKGYAEAMKVARRKQPKYDSSTAALIEASYVLRRMEQRSVKSLADPRKIRILDEIRRRTEYILLQNHSKK